MNAEFTRQQQQDWDAVAGDWSTHFDRLSAAFAPLVHWFRSAMPHASDIRVLDLACGMGIPSLPLAEALGAASRIVATDLSSEMVRVASARAVRRAIPNAEFLTMDAQSLQFEDATFDAVSCAMGLMFFPRPADALAEIFRVLKPHGRVAISTWATPAQNPLLAVYGRALAEVLQLPRQDRTAPGPFRFTNVRELETLFMRAGFDNVVVEELPFEVQYESVDVYLQVSAALTPGLTSRLNKLHAEDAARIHALVREALAPFMRDEVVRLTATPICLSANKQGA